MAGRDRRPQPGAAPVFPEPDDLFDPDAALEAIRAKNTAIPEAMIEAEEAPEAREAPGLGGPLGEDPLPVPDLAGDADELGDLGGTDVESVVDEVVFEAEVESDPGPAASGAEDPKERSGPENDPFFETSQDPRIPKDQESFRIGEVAQLVGVRPYVIRYWEAEFPSIEPDKTEAGQRRYGREDVARLLQIKRLRHDHQLTVAQTRAVVEEGASPSAVGPAIPNLASEDRRAIKTELTRLRREVLDLLEWVQD
ncbi:MAG: MerR family transcriptional regulator [Myxococcota bacterium]